VLLPTGDLAALLDSLAHEVAAVAGAGHWPSGAAGAAHVTIRALEPYRPDPLDDDAAERYIAAFGRAAAAVGPITISFRGLALSVGSVMAWAESAGGAGDHLRRRFGVELGDDGWLEAGVFPNGRDAMWYSSILHFAGPVRDPQELVAWVEARHHFAIGAETFTSAALCRWTFNGSAMHPAVVATAALG
jgi:hypothetical protein